MSVVAGLGGEAAAGPLMDYADATVDRDPTGYPLAVTEAAVQDPRGGAWDFPAATKWAAINEGRILDDGAIAIGRLRRNFLQYSEDLTQSAWAKLNSPTITADDATAPDGESDADRLTFAAGGAGGQVRQTVSGGPTGQVVYQVWLKQAVAAAGASVTLYYRNADLSTELAEDVTPGDDWTLYTRVLDGGSGGSSPLCGLIESTDGADFHVWGLSLIQGDFAQPYVRTVASRHGLPDDVVMSVADIDASFFDGTWDVSVGVEWDAADAPATAYVFWIDANNYLAIVAGTTARLRIGGVNYDRTIAPSAGDELTMNVDFAGGTFGVDGGATVAITGTWSAGNARVGSASNGPGGGHLGGTVGRPLA
ncbi:MAG: hypothetical protein JJ863_21315 [Deltaproteobacteria bacterium]|nr:hypothetical protein [Deltaproteobacteria bacterium]